MRGGKHIPLKHTVDEALVHAPDVHHVIVYKRTDKEVNWVKGRDLWWDDIVVSHSRSGSQSDIVERKKALPPCTKDGERRPFVYFVYFRFYGTAEGR